MPLSLPTSWCKFCFREFSEVSRDSEKNQNVKGFEHFLSLFKLYKREGILKVCDDDDLIRLVPINGSVTSPVGTCPDCLLLVQDFCDLFHQVKVLELKLDWKLQSLKSIMRSADKVPWRRKRFHEKFHGTQNQEKLMLLEFKKFRSKLVSSISKKLKLAGPKVKLLKCQDLNILASGDGESSDCSNVLNTELFYESKEKVEKLINSDKNVKTEVLASQPFLAKQEDFEGSDINDFNGIDESIPCPSPVASTSSGLIANERTPTTKMKTLENDDDTDEDRSYDTEAEVTSFHQEDSNAHPNKSRDTVKHEEQDRDESAMKNIPRHTKRRYTDRRVISSKATPGAIPTLKELAFQQTMESRYTCNAEGCPSRIRTYYHIGDLHRHSTHHGSFNCKFCNFVAYYARNLSKHEIEEHSEKLELNTKTVYKCPRCRFESGALSVLKYHHLEVHLKLTPDRRTCAICYLNIHDDTCSSVREMARSHYYDFHDLEGVKYGMIVRCNSPNCQAYFRSVDQLNRHQDLVHESETHLIDPNLGIPSLKDLALKQTMQMKYECSVKECPANIQTFFNIGDLRNHSSHHGNFPCVFCEFQATYAPHLIEHEIEMHSRKIKLEDKSEKKHKCPRCTDVFKGLGRLKLHLLKRHLKLAPNLRTCGICKLSMPNNFTLKHGYAHYHDYHDFTGVDLKKVKWCGMENCGAYFRSSSQLLHHKILCHSKQKKNWAKLRGPRGHVTKQKKKRVNIGCHSWIRQLPLSPHALKKIQCEKICNVEKCRNVFFSEEDFKRHSKLHGRFECLKCSKVENYANDLILHEMTHEKEKYDSRKIMKCPRCEFSIANTAKSRTALIRHFLKNHLGLTLDCHTCPVCDIQLRSCETGRRRSGGNCYPLPCHLEKHHDFSSTSIYNCEEPECHAYFNSTAQLFVHQNSHNMNMNPDSTGTKVQCKFCQKLFFDRRSYLGHVNRHHRKDFPYICPTHGCVTRFQTRQEYDRHISGENEIVDCPECGKSFHKNKLAGHTKRIHSANRKPKTNKTRICEVCGKEFKNSTGLRQHALWHSTPDSWKFTCETCGKKCLTRAKLEEHKRTHSNEKPFTCQFCGMSYAHRHNLRHHINNKHCDDGDIGPPLKKQKLTYAFEKPGMKKQNSGMESSQKKKSTRKRAKAE